MKFIVIHVTFYQLKLIHFQTINSDHPKSQITHTLHLKQFKQFKPKKSVKKHFYLLPFYRGWSLLRKF